MEAGQRDSGTAGQDLHLLLGDRLAMLGLREIERVVTHTNRTVMLSLNRRVLRIHRGYAHAPDRVLKAIVRFLNRRVPRALRRAAEREFLHFPVEEHAPPRPRPCARERARPGDLVLLHRLTSLHQRLNAEHFGGTLGEIPIRLSSRMRTRLGELAVEIRSGRPLDIAISRRHIARHSWSEVEHTMLHEMVHQWQAETELRIDHGPTFRKKAREVGVLPSARRPLSNNNGAGSRPDLIGHASWRHARCDHSVHGLTSVSINISKKPILHPDSHSASGFVTSCGKAKWDGRGPGGEPG